MGIEDPDVDAAEQRRLVTDLDDEDEDDELGGSTHTPLETDPADFAEQHRVVTSADEDDAYS